MYDIHSSLFQYKLIFIVELIVYELMIGILFHKKNYFTLRVILFVVLVVGIIFALPIVFYNAYYVSILFTVMFFISFLLLKICYDEKYSNLLLCGVFAYVSQHISYVLGNFVSNMLNLEFVNVYEQTSFTEMSIFSLLLGFIIYLILYVLIMLFVMYKKRKEEKIIVGNITLIFVALAMLLVNVLMNAIISYQFTINFDKTFLVVYTIYDTICAIFIIGILVISISNASLKDKIDTIHILWEKDKEVYRIKKEKMESMAIMCHDLRHRLQSLNSHVEDKSQIENLERQIGMYDLTLKTGNNVLDVILSETEIYCKTHKIDFVCIADGTLLDFISENDLYSLFDNMLHNAIDGCEQIETSEEKFIYLTVKKKNSIILISIENSFSKNKKIVFGDDGLPLTTHQNKYIHGLGMKSIKLIVDTYGGTFNINADNGKFHLSLIFTRSEK